LATAISRLLQQGQGRIERLHQNTGIVAEIVAAAQMMNQTYNRDFDEPPPEPATGRGGPGKGDSDDDGDALAAGGKGAKGTKDKTKTFKYKEKRKRELGQANRKRGDCMETPPQGPPGAHGRRVRSPSRPAWCRGEVLRRRGEAGYSGSHRKDRVRV
jgi:hypothetical protein